MAGSTTLRRASKRSSGGESSQPKKLSNTLRQGKMASSSAAVFPSSDGEGGALQDMVDELWETEEFAKPVGHNAEGNFQQHATTDAGLHSGYSGKGKGSVRSKSFAQSPTSSHEACPVVDKEVKPFPIMMMPPEIRNEIYRACLTRPFNILLSRKDPFVCPPAINQKDDIAPEDVVDLTADTDESSDDSDDTTLTTVDTLPGIQSREDWSDRRSRFHAWRNARRTRLQVSRPSLSASNGNGSANSRPIRLFPRTNPRHLPPRPPPKVEPREPRPQDVDPLLVNLLRSSKTVYQEARSILYSENLFTLNIETALTTLAALHQRSRRQIKHVELEIPCYNEILERFQETVRLSLRYCWGLQTFVIHMPFTLPGGDTSASTGNTTVYANGFDILRWLPRQCEVVLRGNVCDEIKAVVSKNANLAKTLDELAYARRQLISNETENTERSRSR